MCIFSGEVERVQHTRIFTAPIQGSRQVVVYENTVKQSTPSAMILPVPNTSGDAAAIKLHDLTAYPAFFEDLDKLFPKVLTRGGNMRGLASLSLSAPLEVQMVGSYNVTIVPRVADVPRIQFDKFPGVTPNVQQVLQKYYADGFSFLVCVLRESGPQHAFCYTHPMEVFDEKTVKTHHHGIMPQDRPGKGASKKMIFVPTRHQHGGETEEMQSEWDHAIYSANTTRMGDRVGDISADHKTVKGSSKVRWDKLLGEEELPREWKSLWKQTMRYTMPNGDVFYYLLE